MTIDGRQDSDSETEARTGPIAQSDLKNAGRRRFGKSGMAASGVLATLASGPVLGDVLQCKSPSGSLSGGHSTHGPAPVCNGGRSPGYWKNAAANQWPIAPTKPFKTIFTTTNGSPYHTASLLTVLDPDFDNAPLGRHIVAAYLNAISTPSLTPFLSGQQVVAMWNEILASGFYTPTAGVKWPATAAPGQPSVVAYLTSTMT
ncbi:MAG: hypothetical protein JWR21_1964 [Herminiimonas sp.]|nr:hypothetical protein [Herminiimonas sp.]